MIDLYIGDEQDINAEIETGKIESVTDDLKALKQSDVKEEIKEENKDTSTE